MKIIIDHIEGDYYVGRTEFDSLEVDLEVLIRYEGDSLRVGNLYQIEVIGSDEFDLSAKVI